jgi:hypothetical protein
MPNCIFAAHAGPSGAKLGGVTKPNLFVGARPPPATDPILTMDRRSCAVLADVFAARMALSVSQLWGQLGASKWGSALDHTRQEEQRHEQADQVGDGHATACRAEPLAPRARFPAPRRTAPVSSSGRTTRSPRRAGRGRSRWPCMPICRATCDYLLRSARRAGSAEGRPPSRLLSFSSHPTPCPWDLLRRRTADYASRSIPTKCSRAIVSARRPRARGDHDESGTPTAGE